MAFDFVFSAQDAPTGSVGITVANSPTVNAAPAAYVFEVDLSALSGFTAAAGSGVYDPRKHDIEYLWDFGESYLFSAPSNIYDGSAAWADGYRNSRYALGFQAAHVYREPGTYTVTLTAYEPATGVSATATASVTIGNPDTVFSGTDTIVLSPSGDSAFFALYPSATQLTSGDVGAAFSTYVHGDRTASPKRIVLNRGEAYTNFDFNATNCTSCHIVAGGTGAKPTVSVTGDVLNWTDDGSPTSGRDFVIQNIAISGNITWLTTSPSGGLSLVNTPDPFPGPWAGAGSLGLFLLDGVKATDISKVASGAYVKTLFMNDLSVDGFSMAGAVYEHKFVVGIGSAFRHRPASWADSVDGTNGWGFRHGPISDWTPVADGTWNCNLIYFGSEFFLKKDWGSESTSFNGQPALRLNTDGASGANPDINIHGCYMEAGWGLVMNAGLANPNAAPFNCLFKNNYMVGTLNTAYGVERWLHGGATIANNILVLPPLVSTSNQRSTPTSFYAYFQTGGTVTHYQDNLNQPIRLFQNTIINLRGSSMSVGSAGAHLATTIENNVLHQPNLGVPDTDQGPLVSGTDYFTPHWDGYISSTQDVRTTSRNDLSGGEFDLYAPATTSNAIGDVGAGELTSWRDFRGVIRPAIAATHGRNQSAGAIEPDLAA